MLYESSTADHSTGTALLVSVATAWHVDYQEVELEWSCGCTSGTERTLTYKTFGRKGMKNGSLCSPAPTAW